MRVACRSLEAAVSRNREGLWVSLGPRAPPLRPSRAAPVSRPLPTTAFEHMSCTSRISSNASRFRLLPSAFASSGFCSGSFDQLSGCGTEPSDCDDEPNRDDFSRSQVPPLRQRRSDSVPVSAALRRRPLSPPAGSALRAPRHLLLRRRSVLWKTGATVCSRVNAAAAAGAARRAS